MTSNITKIGATMTDTAANGSSDPRRLVNSELGSEIQFLLARARAKGSGMANSLLAPLDLKVREYSVLSLAATGIEPTQSELAHFLKLDPSRIVSTVDALQSRGLVERRVDPNDRRSKIIVATKAGEELYKQARAINATADDISLSNLNERERKIFYELLFRIAY